MVQDCLKLRRFCWLPNQRFALTNIRPMPAPNAAVSRGVTLVEKSVDDVKLFSSIIHLYRRPFLQESETKDLLRKAQANVSSNIIDIKTEQCFNVELESALSSEKLIALQWLLAETYEPENLQSGSFLEEEVLRSPYSFLVEVGPRMTFSTAFSTNAVSICKALSLLEVTRLERSRRYLLCLQPGSVPLDESQLNSFAALVHDRMTDCVYPSKLTPFQSDVVPEPVSVIPVMKGEVEHLRK